MRGGLLGRGGDMDINLGVCLERLRRLLAGDEVTLPDAAKQLIQNLHIEIEIVTSWMIDYEFSTGSLLMQIIAGDPDHQTHSADPVQAIIQEINCFAYESEKVIDTFIISVTQKQGQSVSKDICDTLLGLQSKIIDIQQRLPQVERVTADAIEELKPNLADAENAFVSSGFKKRTDKEGLDDTMEELLDLLIEGPPQLSVVAILDSIGFDYTAFAAEAYHSKYVKHYFDCHAWVPVSLLYDSEHALDYILKFLIPSSWLSKITDKNYEMKKAVLHDYLMNKRYLIVLDDVWGNDVWDDIREILPDNQNGSRVLTTITEITILASFQLENGENFSLQLEPTGGPLRVAYKGWTFHILYHGTGSLEGNILGLWYGFSGYWVIQYSMLPFHLKPCCLYMSVFPAYLEISTKQLYQLWIAEGFISDNNEATAEDYLEKLINIGFVEAKKRRVGGRIKTCSTPGRWWLHLMSLASKVEFINARQKANRRRLAAHVKVTEVDFLDDLDSCLHSFLYHSSASVHLDPLDCEKICKMFKLLKVLDLGSLLLNQYPSGIENLLILRYLKLNIPSLKALPSSLLSNLMNLYTLDMPSSYIGHTADDFWKMNKLRHLNFGSITLPAHPGKYCGSLENLNFISALHPCCCTEDILGRLPNLRNLQIWGDLSYYQPLLQQSLCRLSCLESLKLVNESKMPRLSKIVLADYLFPQSLTHLSFSNTEIMEDPMPALEKLPLLQVLKLKQNSYSGRKLTCGSHGFPKLKVLHLKSMLWLEEWTMGIGAMPKLECLIINPCAYLKKIPEQLWCIKSLNKLECWWPQPELRQKLRDFEDKAQYDIQLYPYGI